MASTTATNSKGNGAAKRATAQARAAVILAGQPAAAKPAAEPAATKPAADPTAAGPTAAPAALKPAAEPAAAGSATKPVIRSITDESRGAGSLVMERGELRYRARWAQPGAADHLRVNVRVEPAGNGTDRQHVETLDLFSANSQERFATRAAKWLNAKADTIHDDLAELLAAVDRAQADLRAAAFAKADDAAPKMTDEERAEALAFLQDPDLMGRIVSDLEFLGYTGEETNKALCYLISISRKLPEPLSGILISQSGAGKSYLAGLIARLTPKEDLIFWSRVTPQALYWVEKDQLKHKLVIIEEREGSDSADYAIRAMQSQGRLVQAVVLKDPGSGMMQTRTLEADGPASFLETTAKPGEINPENATRSFEMYLDESQAQTERIHEAQREAITPEGLGRKKQGEKLVRLHQNAQRLLEPARVGVPFAKLLRFPKDNPRTRRDNARMQNLLMAVAFLHQKQRARRRDDDGEYIEATPVDYAITYGLAREIFAVTLDELHKAARDLLEVIQKKARDLGALRGVSMLEVRITQREVREWSAWPHHQVKRAMGELEELGYLEVERAGRGSRFTYRLVTEHGNDRAPLAGIISPAELINRLADAEQAAKTQAAGGHGGGGGRGPAAGAGASEPKSEKKVGQSGKQACPTTFRPKK